MATAQRGFLMLFEGAVLQEPTQAAFRRLLSRFPGLEPPLGSCSTRPSDTIVLSRSIADIELTNRQAARLTGARCLRGEAAQQVSQVVTPGLGATPWLGARR